MATVEHMAAGAPEWALPADRRGLTLVSLYSIREPFPGQLPSWPPAVLPGPLVSGMT